VITPNGWYPAEEIGIPILSKDRDYYNTFPLNSDLVSEAYNALQKSGEDIVSGPFVTIQQCTGRADIGNDLALRFNAICENMEGAAAAHICTLYDMPFLELRAISNRVENRNKDAWDIALAIEQSQLAAQKLIETLK
jgi:futalosine hydrolase